MVECGVSCVVLRTHVQMDDSGERSDDTDSLVGLVIFRGGAPEGLHDDKQVGEIKDAMGQTLFEFLGDLGVVPVVKRVLDEVGMGAFEVAATVSGTMVEGEDLKEKIPADGK